MRFGRSSSAQKSSDARIYSFRLFDCLGTVGVMSLRVFKGSGANGDGGWVVWDPFPKAQNLRQVQS